MPDGSPGIFDQTVQNVTASITYQVSPRTSSPCTTIARSRRWIASSEPGVEPSKAAGGRTPVLLLHRRREVDFADHQPVDVRRRMGRERTEPQYRDVPAWCTQVRGTPAWYANASHVDLVTGATTIGERRRNIHYRAVVHVDRVGDLRDRVPQYQGGSSAATASTAWSPIRTPTSSSGIAVGFPISVQVRNSPTICARGDVAPRTPDLGVYAQDSWQLRSSDAQPWRALLLPARSRWIPATPPPVASCRLARSPAFRTCSTGRTWRRALAPPTT